MSSFLRTMAEGWSIHLRRYINTMDGYRHFPERMKRQYGFVQDIPIHPSDVPAISVIRVLQAFKDFRTCCIPLE